MSEANNPERLAEWKRWSDDVVRAAAGHWPEILRRHAPSLERALAAAPAGRPPRHVPCPSHGGKDGFRMMPNHAHTGGGICNTCGPKPGGISLLRWVNDWSYKEAVVAVADYLNMPWSAGEQQAVAAPRPLAPIKPPREELEKARTKDILTLRKLNDLIKAAAPVEWSRDNPATRYFQRRGLGALLADPPSDLLLHPGLEYWHQAPEMDAAGRAVTDAKGNEVTKLQRLGEGPAILAMVREPGGSVIGVHRIWITADGRKRFWDWSGPGHAPDAKRLAALPSCLTVRGAAVRLYDATQSLGVAEGIETALGARLLVGLRQRGRRLPVWAGVTAFGVETMELPAFVSDVSIFADNDQAGTGQRQSPFGRGEEAGIELRRRLDGQGGARIFLPPKVGTDWLDVYVDYQARLARLERRYESIFLTPEQLAQRALDREVHRAELSHDAERDRHVMDAPDGGTDGPEMAAPNPATGENAGSALDLNDAMDALRAEGQSDWGDSDAQNSAAVDDAAPDSASANATNPTRARLPESGASAGESGDPPSALSRGGHYVDLPSTAEAVGHGYRGRDKPHFRLRTVAPASVDMTGPA